MKQLLLFVMTLLPMIASADVTGKCGTNVYYTYNESLQKLTVYGEGPMYNYEDMMDDYMYPWRGCSIKYLEIEDGVTSVGDFNFPNKGMISLGFPNSVTSIGYCAFYGCGSLTSITLPNSLTRIGKNAFDGCNSLTTIVSEIENPFSIDNSVFSSVFSKATLIVPKGTISKYMATDGWKSFANIVEATGNEEADITDNGIYYHLKSDGSLEVTGLASWTTVADIPSSIIVNSTKYRVTSIGAYAFNGRSDITYLSIPYSVKSIGEYAFMGCGSSMTVNIADPESWCQMQLGNEHASPLSSAGKMLVHDIETTSFEVPSTVTSIGAFTFYQCSCLKSLFIPGTVTSIGSSAFEDCDYLTSLTLDEGLQSIGGSAFEGCKRLANLVLPSTVNSILMNAFKNCVGLTDVYCFAANVPSTDASAFTGVATENVMLHVPDNAINAYKSTWPWSYFKGSIDMSKSRTIYVGVAGTLSNYIPTEEIQYVEELTLTGYLNGTDIGFIRRMAGAPLNYDWTWGGTYEEAERGQVYGRLAVLDISDATIVAGGDYYYNGWADIDLEHEYHRVDEYSTSNNTISKHMFEDCKFTKVFLPNNIMKIESAAFDNCESLTRIDIPQSVTSFSACLSGCSSLTSIKVESGNQTYDSRNDCNAIIKKSSNTLIEGCNNTIIPNTVISIGDYAFFGCKGLTSINIPNSVTSIGNYAFYQCSGLASVTIPNSVTSIGDGAFYSCSSLTAIYCNNSVPPACSYSFSNKEKCVVWVPKGSINAYKEANEWKDFKNIKEIMDGDVNLDGKVNKDDVDALVAYIMGENSEMVKEYMIDVNRDGKVNIADVTRVISITQSEAKP